MGARLGLGWDLSNIQLKPDLALEEPQLELKLDVEQRPELKLWLWSGFGLKLQIATEQQTTQRHTTGKSRAKARTHLGMEKRPSTSGKLQQGPQL